MRYILLILIVGLAMQVAGQENITGKWVAVSAQNELGEECSEKSKQAFWFEFFSDGKFHERHIAEDYDGTYRVENDTIKLTIPVPGFPDLPGVHVSVQILELGPEKMVLNHALCARHDVTGVMRLELKRVK